MIAAAQTAAKSPAAPMLKPTPAFQKTRANLLQRKCACGGNPGMGGECEECRRKKLQRRAVDAPHLQPLSPERRGETAPPIVNEVLNSFGQPLDVETRGLLETRFGHDFSRVRVHTDGRAAESARAVNALAYTVGSDIVFDKGQYSPNTFAGQKLIAHELTHVVQQSSVASGIRDGLEIGAAEDAAEIESDTMAERVSASGMDSVATSSRTTQSRQMVQRKVSPDYSTIEKLLGKKNVTAADVHQVLVILRRLAPDDLKDTVAEMEKRGYVDTFFLNLSEDDKKGEFNTLRAIKNARVFKVETKSGKTTVETEVVGSCAPDQFTQIAKAATTGLRWLDTSVARIDAYTASPADPKNVDVESAYKTHFHSIAPEVVKHVRERLVRIRTDIGSTAGYNVECHGSWDKECDVAGAYAGLDNRTVVVLCLNFFENSAEWQAETIVHETAHNQVSGAHITDRAYEGSRIYRYLTTLEALTNADSYGLFVQQLGSGKAPAMKTPKDTTEDCPKAWIDNLNKAIAVADRWNQNALVTFSTLRSVEVQNWSKDWQELLGGTSDADISRGYKVYEKTLSKLKSGVDFECEPKGGGRCDKGVTTYWYALGDFHICPLWENTKDEGDRVERLLSGLFGYFRVEDDNARRNRLAKLAREISGGWSAPTKPEEVFGSAKWTPNDIFIWVQPIRPKTNKFKYIEDATTHDRMSQDLPVFTPPPRKEFEPRENFVLTIEYLIDAGDARPAPFTPPHISEEFHYKVTGGGFDRKEADDRPLYMGNGKPLNTRFFTIHDFPLDQPGTFQMHLSLFDPDTKVTRIYDDTIQVQAAPPATTGTP